MFSKPEQIPRCLAAYWAECERHRGGAANANERETGDLLPSAVNLRYTTQGLEENVLNSGSSTRLYGMRLTAALYNGAVRGQPVDSHVIICHTSVTCETSLLCLYIYHIRHVNMI